MATVLVKAYVRQPFGTHDVYLIGFDPKTSDLEELKQEISCLVGELPVQLAWLDRDGDHIHLDSDRQLKFALAHGLQDNVLRVSVRVCWSGRNPTVPSSGASRRAGGGDRAQGEDVEDMKRRRTAAPPPHTTDETSEDGPVARAFALPSDSDRAGKVEPEIVEVPGEPVIEEVPDDTEEEGLQLEPEIEELPPTETTSPRPPPPTPRRPLPPIPTDERPYSNGTAAYAGYVRTTGPDGITRERQLSEEEAAFILNRSHSFGMGQWPFSFGGPSLFGHQPLAFRQPTSSPYYLGW